MNTEEKIKHFLENSETLFKRSLIIDDEWGTGKSTIVKNLLSGRPSTSRLSLNTNIVSHYKIIDVCDIEINHDFIAELYISSNKINTNTNDITDKTKKITSWLAKKGSPMLKELDIKYLNIVPTATSIITSTIMEKSSFNKHVLVIDEFERCTDYKKMEWLLLKISKLQENFNIKIIIIMNSKKLDESVTKLFNEWKEKISSLQINILSDFFSRDNTPQKYKNHKNRNIRLIEKYNIIEKEIDNKLNKEIVNYNTSKNDLINEKIQDLKDYIYDLYCEYYSGETPRYPFFVEKLKIDYIKYPHLKELDIKDLDNLDYEFLDYKIQNIVKKCNDKNYKINEGILRFKKDIYNKMDLKRNNFQNNKLKNLAINILKNNIFENNNCFHFFTFDYDFIMNKKFDEYCIFSYLKLIDDNFKINKSDKKYFAFLLRKALETTKSNFISKNPENKFDLWMDINKISNYSIDETLIKMSRYKYLIINSNFLLKNDKKKVLKKLNKLISYMYSSILNETNFEYKSWAPKSILYEFHAVNNVKILNIIYKKNDYDIVLLKEEIKILKNILQKKGEEKWSDYTGSDKNKLIYDFVNYKLKKIKDFHNVNIIDRQINEKITKANAINKLKDEFFEFIY